MGRAKLLIDNSEIKNVSISFGIMEKHNDMLLFNEYLKDLIV